MSKVERIDRQIQDLSPDELRLLREWFLRYDSERWDRQFEMDVQAGKLDMLAENALRDHAEGRSTNL